MGYTHYFSYDPDSEPFIEAFPRMQEDAERILDYVEAAGVRICRDPFDGTLPREYKVIAFNGSVEDELDREPLVIMLRWPGPSYRNSDGRILGFCKTGGFLPYDPAVAAVLLRCHRLLPGGFAINSDGLWDGEWLYGDRKPTTGLLSARIIVRELFGDNDTSCPFDPNWAGRRES